MIAIDRPTKKYGPAIAMDDVSFTAAPGRVTGCLGPNGAGKATTMRMAVGLTRPTSGTATVLGRRFPALADPLTDGATDRLAPGLSSQGDRACRARYVYPHG
jgi:ABC-2 type transport system ATP-binding protein